MATFSAIPRKIVLFRWLSPAHLPLAYALRWLGFGVWFLEPFGRLRNLAEVQRMEGRGLRWINLSDLPDHDPYARYKVLSRYSRILLDELFPLPVVTSLAKRFPPVTNLERKLRIVLHETVTNAVEPVALALGVAEYLSARGSRVWVFQGTNPVSARIFGRHSQVRSLFPWPLAVALLAGRWGIAKLTAAAAQAFRKTEPLPASALVVDPAGAKPLGAEVLYFPHQGLSYGDLFEKNQYYSAEPSSPLHRSRVCHIELWSSMSPAVQEQVAESYRRKGLPFYRLVRGRQTSGWRGFLEFRRGLPTSTGWIASIYALLTLRRFEGAASSLAPFMRAKLALLGYEHLFPKVMCLALQSCGIKVAASQERFILTFHDTFNALLDSYYVIGEVARQRFAANPLCCIDNIVVIGDVRTDLIRRYADGSPSQKMSSSKVRHVCLLLDFHSIADPFANSMSVVNSWASNLRFYEDVLHLVRDFPEVSFIIRGKDLEWCALEAFAGVLKQMQSEPNIVINRDYVRFDESYRLASSADSIIARHTSLGDQCLAFGRPVLFHEVLANSAKCVAWVHDYAPWPLLTHSYDELASRFRTIVRNRHHMSAAEVQSLAEAYYNGIPDGRIGERLVEGLNALLQGDSAVEKNREPALTLSEAS